MTDAPVSGTTADLLREAADTLAAFEFEADLADIITRLRAAADRAPEQGRDAVLEEALETVTVEGAYIDLENGGKVFLGASKDHPDIRFVKFVNAEGVETKLRLSTQAVDALRQLTDDMEAIKKSVWRYIVTAADALKSSAKETG